MIHDYHMNYENINLRPLEMDDIESLRVWRNNPNNSLYLNDIPYITKEMQREWFERYLNNEDELCFAIEETSELNRIVGSCSLYNFSKDKCSFGKLLIGDNEAHGKKVGLNATKTAVYIALKIMSVKRVDLFVYADNKAALNVYKQAGFDVIDEKMNNSRIEYTMSIMECSIGAEN